MRRKAQGLTASRVDGAQLGVPPGATMSPGTLTLLPHTAERQTIEWALSITHRFF